MTAASSTSRATWPLVSVCIPSYNQEAYIGETLESVLGQSYGQFECVVTDDCSTDRTFEIVQSFKDPRLRALRNPKNLGVEGNWNQALGQARGAYVKILCGDDLLYPRCLERQVLALERAENANAVLVCCSRDVISPASQRILTRRAAARDVLIPGPEAIRRNVRAGTNRIGEPSGVLFRASVLPKVGRFDGALPYLIDLDMWARMLEHGDMVVLSESLFGFRVSQTQLSFALASRQSREFRGFIDRTRGRVGYVGRRDALLGALMSYANMLARKVFYALFLSKFLRGRS